MRTTLICRLHENQHQVSWSLFDASNTCIDTGTQVVTEPLPQSPTVVLLPTTSILLTKIAIPSKKWQKIVQAIPYLIEEQLIDEVENLHFALGERHLNTDQIAVAVIAHQQFSNYLALLQQITPKITLCIPDIFAVPKPEEGWGILYTEDCVLVRTGAQTGFAIEPHCLSIALQSAESLPAQLTVFSSDDKNVNKVNMTDLYALGIPVVEEISARGTLAWWQQGVINTKPINLLQGIYRPIHKSMMLWRPWRLTAILLIIWGITEITMQIVIFQQLETERQMLTTQIETVYRDTFPEARKVVNAKVQMEQQLNTLRLGKNIQKNDFLAMLIQLSPFLSQLPNLVLKRIDYKEEYFDVLLETTHLQSLEQLKHSLQTVHLQLEIQAVSSRNNHVEAHLRISAIPSN